MHNISIVKTNPPNAFKSDPNILVLKGTKDYDYTVLVNCKIKHDDL